MDRYTLGRGKGVIIMCLWKREKGGANSSKSIMSRTPPHPHGTGCGDFLDYVLEFRPKTLSCIHSRFCNLIDVRKEIDPVKNGTTISIY